MAIDFVGYSLLQCHSLFLIDEVLFNVFVHKIDILAGIGKDAGKKSNWFNTWL